MCTSMVFKITRMQAQTTMIYRVTQDGRTWHKKNIIRCVVDLYFIAKQFTFSNVHIYISMCQLTTSRAQDNCDDSICMCSYQPILLFQEIPLYRNSRNQRTLSGNQINDLVNTLMLCTSTLRCLHNCKIWQNIYFYILFTISFKKEKHNTQNCTFSLKKAN